METNGENRADEIREPKRIDTGLMCLVMVAGYHGLAVDPEQLRHTLALGPEGMGTIDILRGARELGLKAKEAQVSFDRLKHLHMPAIASFDGGKYIVLAKTDSDKVLIFDPGEGKPQLLSKNDFIGQWKERIILLTYRKSTAPSERPFGLTWFLPSIWKYRKPLFEVLTASLILQIFGLVTPVFTQVIIDKVLVHRGITTLNVLAIGLITVILFEGLLNILRTYLFTHTSNRIDISLGTKLFKHLFSLPLKYFEVRRVGDTVARVRELENIRHFLTGAPLTTILDVMFIGVYLVVMFIYSTTLSFVVLGAIPVFALLSLIITPMLRHRLDERFNRGAESQAFLVEMVTGAQTVKAMAVEPEVQKRWESLLANYVKASFRTSKLSGVAGSLGQLIERGSTLAILWLGAHLVMRGDLTVGQLIAFQMLSGRVSGPVLRLVQLWQDFQQTGLSIRRLGDIFHATPEPSLNVTKTRFPAIQGHIRLEGVRFRYRLDGPEIIRNIDLDIKPGMILGIVGRSGSGKSTLAKLIQRLYLPESGRILIDGIDLSLADPAWLRRQIGVVLQESFLFNGSVRDNIAFHYPQASMEEVMKAANLAGAHEFVLELPEGYDTIVGERGTALSGGQRQRIAIARALLTNPRILIFDEATSSLDSESEAIIQRNLRQICRGRTVILIAHRLSTLRIAERIIVLEKGEIVESGTHDELMDKKGLYHHLQIQQAPSPSPSPPRGEG
ncbi:MAG: type I secretion system permease/ATPase [Deltaproteobacteria bacterium]|nr:type I secretion system permease/ATPase [Deltaproteobacteria bacterium]